MPMIFRPLPTSTCRTPSRTPGKRSTYVSKQRKASGVPFACARLAPRLACTCQFRVSARLKAILWARVQSQ